MKKNITIYDIAKEAGVSPATVSRIVTGSTAVSPAKRERVMELIDKYHFRPNALARALTVTQSYLIGMLVADSGNPYYISVFTAIENEAFKRGYATLMMNTHSTPAFEITMLTKLRELQPDAIIVCGGRIDLEQSDPAFLNLLSSVGRSTRLIAASRCPMPGVPGIAIDHRASMDLAMQYLIGLGHREIGFIYTGDPYYGTRQRLVRFREIIQEYQLPFREEWLIHVPAYDAASGRTGVEKLLQCEKLPTALLGMNDMVSAGILRELSHRGVRVPEDISVIGFDDTFVSAITSPELTSVSYDYQLFASMLLDAALYTGPIDDLPADQLVPVFITERKSCRKVGGA